MSRKRPPAKQIEARSRWVYLTEWTHSGERIKCVSNGGVPAWRVRGQLVADPQAAMDVAEGKCPEQQAAVRAECLAVDRANRECARMERAALAARHASL